MKKLLLLLLLNPANYVAAQNELTLDLNAVKTELKQNAIGFAVNYLKPYNGIEKQFNNSHGFLNITPEVSMQAGTTDAFSQVIVKLSGFYLSAKKITIAGLPVLDSKSTMHVFPLSAGFETNTEFSFLNTLIETGYIPYYQGQGNTSVSDFFKLTKIGFFLQAGYKSMLDSAGLYKTSGGKKDESGEKLNNGLLRSRIDLLIDTKNFFNTNSIGFGLVGRSSWWFDFINSQWYYKIDGRARIYLSANKFFDLVYQKGSGAPNFNTGEQFGTALSLTF